MTSGFLVTFSDLPVYVSWVRHISCISYGYRILLSNEFSNRVLSGCPYPTREACVQYDGNVILDRSDVAVNDFITPFCVLIGIMIGYHAVAMLLLVYVPQPPIGSVGGDDKGVTAGENDRLTISRDKRILTSAETRRCGSSVTIEVKQVRLSVTVPSSVSLSTPHLASTPSPDSSLSSPCEGQKILLYEISAVMRPGRLTALMGGSGCGKSTMLNLIAGRIPIKQIKKKSIKNVLQANMSSVYSMEGAVEFNGQQTNKKELQNLVGYVEQHDHHLPSLTVRETMEFAALMSMSTKVSKIRREQAVETMMSYLGLTKCGDVRVGGVDVKGISGGEKRRLSIGVQLIHSPPVCLLDEPTTGLDASTARDIMDTLHEMALDGHCVVVSIHQPRYDIFELIDDILLLTRGQQVWGGSAKDCLSHLDSLGYPCPKYTNPADFLLDLTSIDFRTEESDLESRKRWNILVTAFQAKIQTDIEAIILEDKKSGLDIQIDMYKGKMKSVW
eukprot:CAMPEP_0182436626 /NCGR_PEP_ID=MMETSP1167-20130531/82524_1 /TAXON_ID=2988 /ORGANISM="Mallomonas Sp, Strain CCMP3275" /LENGTH=500 /DNA_ID=CAMNT_0024628973 /DNA_START=253 /DNA_END=1752 /DNA_ORIENTATION=-